MNTIEVSKLVMNLENFNNANSNPIRSGHQTIFSFKFEIKCGRAFSVLIEPIQRQTADLIARV